MRVFLFAVPVLAAAVVGGGWWVAAGNGDPAQHADHTGHPEHQDREIRLSDGTNILNEECSTPAPGKPQSDTPPVKSGL